VKGAIGTRDEIFRLGSAHTSQLMTRNMKALIRENNDLNRSFSHHDYTIAWISALPTEMAVAEAMLDERFPDLPTPRNNDNTYVLGRMYAITS
jgi:hypothetical protein